MSLLINGNDNSSNNKYNNHPNISVIFILKIMCNLGLNLAEGQDGRFGARATRATPGILGSLNILASPAHQHCAWFLRHAPDTSVILRHQLLPQLPDWSHLSEALHAAFCNHTWKEFASKYPTAASQSGHTFQLTKRQFPQHHSEPQLMSKAGVKEKKLWKKKCLQENKKGALQWKST